MVLSSHWPVEKEEGRMGGINLLAPTQCAHHPEERKQDYAGDIIQFSGPLCTK